MSEGTPTDADRLALVTGTTRGIGEAVAARLIVQGWTVIGIARSPAPIEHARYRHLVLDLRDPTALANTIEDELGPVVSHSRWRRIGLVNNAALSGALGPMETIDPVELLRLSAVNWVAPTWLIGFMVRRASVDVALRIVNVSSGAAVRAFPGLADYCGSKAALRMTGMVTAAEWDSPLRTAPTHANAAILSYEPGTVDTDMQAAARSRPLAEYPWGGLFRDFAARGALIPPAVPASEIVEFLETDGHARFTERRLAR
jgi:NAD(P)-dependent dehydrogenase (short-subunit alcohol dehydrogenase family)